MNQIDTEVPPSGTGCVECEESGSWWVHLRRCAACGHVGCCDDSLNRHATAHAQRTGHAIIQSFEPGEEWFWDFRTDRFATGPVLAPPHSHPDDQSAPGPAARVPENWAEILQSRSRTAD
ncbi:UBP-type zinc finger domain-containing protein [Microbacterium sp. 3J1]|uniref:UBP-type zinc finger domain-containing protein n=1 Tax=Microbacterium sp. 3J1 TaxID=861269 RepID=UPI000AAE89A0|nr:UBP-type zinc finger domain-containing protein [Microbacterium sp. 3J1]